MDLAVLAQAEKIYYEKGGKLDPDDWKKLSVPKMDDLKSRLLKTRERDAESSNLSVTYDVLELQSTDEDGDQRVSCEPPRRHSGRT